MKVAEPPGSLTFGPYDLYILALSILAIVVLAADSLLTLDGDVHEVLGYFDTGLCVLFFADFLRNLWKAPDRFRYLYRSGWLDLLSSLPSFDLFRLGRLSRITRIIRLLRAVRSVRTIGQTITRHRQESAIAAAALVTIILVLFASIAVLQFERHPDANIVTAGDAVWWAFATITTVGYGDRFPVTLEGRLVAAILMAAGVALFGTLSALVASWFLHPETTAAEAEPVEALRAEIAELRAMLERRFEEPAPVVREAVHD